MWISRLDFDYSICAGSDWKDIWIVEKIYIILIVKPAGKR